MNFKPLKGNILLKQRIEEDKTDSGILLSQEVIKHNIGEVIAIDTDEDIKVGDIVYFEASKYFDYTLDGEDYILTKDGHILGVLNG